MAAQLHAAPHTATLVDDLGGWLTAVLDRRGWDDGSVSDEIDELVFSLLPQVERYEGRVRFSRQNAEDGSTSDAPAPPPAPPPVPVGAGR